MKKVKKPGKIAQAILAEVSSKSREADSDEEDITRARVVTEDEENLGEDETWNLDFEEAPRSQLRTKNVQLLSDVDARYGGKKTSRKKLKAESGEVDDEKEHDSAELGFMFEAEDVDDDDADEEDDEAEEDDTESDEDDVEEEEGKSFEFEANGAEVDFGAFGGDSDEEEDDDSDDASGDEDESDAEEQEEDESEAGDSSQKILRQDLKSEVSKGLAIKQQLSNWDGLFECRIQLQKILTKINQYPQPDAWPKLASASSSTDDGYVKTVKKAQTSLANLLDSLNELRVNLINQNPEIRAAVSKSKTKRSRSDDDDEADLEEIEEGESAELQVPAKKMKLRQYEDLLSSDHESFKSFRNSTIEKWNDKTRLATGHLKSKSFAGFESSTLLQIEHILADKSRLIKRTQLKRSAYTILGQKSSNDSSDDDDADKEYDTEIFDDDDFYHQLLRELIERKTEGVTDPLLLGQKWLQIQKMRNKIKRKVDTKASKGRKTRFDIHSKLVNFMAPVYVESVLSEDAKTELFKSLFGKTAK